ncbi:2-C-methyl-D-erythritol 4-phosphate cytidylyltransferase [Collimonas pratensis]|uniref:2-C-methyl-D-erythritol 4-phosphate cytidylyltransferase n=1 Tax=Collimonas pratensis TaxID=279113 RepID=A0ABN4MBE8_9BURK|nr:2-C-methyl-D-erythritol 4-phosphate cytidylyltransferase [Collimonas pratensis]AMP15254.1 2-C-methyl-D-erythritol 4-phosphate cytidylyltransferase [Collimonas pratensis]
MNPSRHFALIPAAGVGARLGAAIPKQYMPLAGQPMLMHVLRTFAAASEISHVFVVVSPDDGYIADLMAAAPHLQGRVTVLYHGGASRQASVLNGLQAVKAQVDEDDWMLVHDAARPGLTQDLIAQLIAALKDDRVGGLLALPVVDTLKRGDQNARVAQTVERSGLWAAQTPQMFRHGLLTRALTLAEAVTDEAGAVELLGLQPRLVEGSPRNFKVTLPHDVALAEMFLKEQV